KHQYETSVIAKIFKLETGEKKVDIIVTHWSYTIMPILEFHTTCIMNCITT
ncbi:hypothetical protein BDR05DRAFT_897091, partial [Suillus weaverae]